MKEYIETRLAPRLQADGGWVEVDSVAEDSVTLVFRGECSKCQILGRCCDWIGQKLEEEFGRKVRVNAVCRKPFFWDT